MSLQDGSALGPYRIVSRLGSGGMGEVYRAHDDRLDRDVAIKILPADVAGDPERLERFEREARATAALNHPNIVALHDIGRADDLTYVVMELLDGTTLADEIQSRPPTPRKTLEWAIQVAEGLAAAHAKGIVHRDVKPENLIVTSDGRVKILDFGIARFTVPQQDATVAATVAAGTEPGLVMGTAGYMSPEQVRGAPIDARSDIFSLGTVLYEMLSGRRPFAGDTAVETMHAVLKVDPPELTVEAPAVPAALDRIVRRCLEKRPEDRFHSAHDLALALDAVSGTHTQPAAAIESVQVRGPRFARPGLAVAAVLLVAATAVVTSWWAGGSAAGTLPSIRQVTTRRGTIDAARYRSGGDSVVYSARFGGAPPTTFEQSLNSPEALQIGPDNAMLFGEAGGGLVLGLEPELYSSQLVGRLATLQTGAGAARELAETIAAADFVAGGVAAIEVTGNGTRVHFPVGNVVEESERFRYLLRASPDETTIAYLHEGEGIVLLGQDGTRAVLEARRVTGIAWEASGERLWYSTATGRGESTIWSMRPGEEPREEWRAAGAAVLQDIAADGRVLLRRDERQGGTLLITPEIEDPVDLSWLDQSQAVGVSVESGTLLLRDAGGMYLRGLDGSPAVRLGGGWAVALSRDGQVAIDMGSPDRVELIPTGIGTPREIEHPGIESYFAWFHPDGRRLLINGREPGGTWRFFELNLDGTGETVAVGPDNLEHYIGQQPLSNDGRWLLGFPLPGHEDTVYSLQGEEPIRVQGLGPGEVVIRFTEDDRAVYVFNRDGLPVRIYRLDYRTGARQLWHEFMPGDPAGVAGVPTVVMTADGRVMAFNYQRVLSTLFEISGLQ